MYREFKYLYQSRAPIVVIPIGKIPTVISIRPRCQRCGHVEGPTAHSVKLKFQPGVSRRSRFKQDVPAELIFLSEYRQKSRGVLQKDRNTDCQAVSQTLRQWFLKKRPVCPTSWASVGPRHRLSLLKSRHLSGSHTKTLRPIVSQTSKRGLTCPVFERTSSAYHGF